MFRKKTRLKIRATLFFLLTLGSIWAVGITAHLINYPRSEWWFWIPFTYTAATGVIVLLVATIKAVFMVADAK